MEQIVVFGGGGHGKTVLDLLGALGTYTVAGVVDDSFSPGHTVAGVPVIGGAGVLAQLASGGVTLAVNGVGGITNGGMANRVAVFEQLAAAGLRCPSLVHPRAWVEPSAHLEAGVQVLAHAYVGSEARVGFGALVNTAAVVSHDCCLGAYVNVSPGALLAGGVKAGPEARFGMGVTVNVGVKIGAGAAVGNGATVKADVGDGAVVRAGATWPVGTVR